MAKGKPQDNRMKAFISEYVQDFNATRAYIAAGYSELGASAGASRLLANVKVREAIEKRVERQCEALAITKSRVLRELALMGFANMHDYITVQDGDAYVDLSKLSREQAAAIQELTVEEYTEGRGEEKRDIKRTKFKLNDKRGALELLGKNLKIFTDKVALTDSNGDAFRVIVEHIGTKDQAPAKAD